MTVRVCTVRNATHGSQHARPGLTSVDLNKLTSKMTYLFFCHKLMLQWLTVNNNGYTWRLIMHKDNVDTVVVFSSCSAAFVEIRNSFKNTFV